MASIPRRSKKRKSARSHAPSLAERVRRHTPLLAHPEGYPEEVMAASRADGRALDVLYFLAEHADAQEEVEMGQQTMAMCFKVQRPTIKTILRHLRDLGELRLIHQGRGRGRTNRYRITVPRPLHDPSSP